MIVHGTDDNFFIVLPILLKTYRFDSFSSLHIKMCAREKSGASQRFYTPERHRHAICPSLQKQSVTDVFKVQ